jgi:hypothetical protein
MKITSWTPLAALTFALLAACEHGDGPRDVQDHSAQIGSNNYGYQPTTPGTANDFVTDSTPPPPPASNPAATDTVVATNSSTPPQVSGAGTNATGATPDQRSLPIATPVEGMPGYVTSPYQPYAGYVDVRGFPPNTQVKDPYSGKIFLVP